MKNYLIFSTISYVLFLFLIELSMSVNPGFGTFAGFNWFISSELISFSYVISWLLQGLALSFAAFLYLQPKTALVDGLRFGLITGFLFIIVVMFNMMIQVDHSIYAFYNDSLLPLVSLQIVGFAINGFIFGLMFEVFTPEFPSIKKLWSLA